MKELLMESYKTTKKMTGVDPSKPGWIRQIISDDESFDVYARSLSEGLKKDDEQANCLVIRRMALAGGQVA